MEVIPKNMNIYILHNQQRDGPFSLIQITDLIRIGKYALTDLAWHEGLNEWKPIHSIPDIVDLVLPSIPVEAPARQEAGFPPLAAEETVGQEAGTDYQEPPRTTDYSEFAVPLAVLLLVLLALSGFYWGRSQPQQTAQSIFEAKMPPMQPYEENSLGIQFVSVPGTHVLFAIWDVRVQDYRVYANANSGVDGAWQNPGFTQGENHPVVCVSWEDAKAFCAWLTQRERAAGKISASQSYRLPTDAEWSVAVGLQESNGGTPKDKDGERPGVYPWGTSWPPPSRAGNYDQSLGVDNFVYTSPVGSFAANRYGLYDMGGNVWQWCEDEYLPGLGIRVLRGASWIDLKPANLLSSYRNNYIMPSDRIHYVGFRCVLAGGSAP